MQNKTESSNTIIRVVTEVDIEGLARLNSIFNDVDETAEAIWRRLDDPKCAEIPIVAVTENQVVGFAGLRIVPNIFYPGAHAEITELFVEEPHRRQGIASAPMRYAEEIARSRSAKEIVLHIGEDNQAARKFYAAIGYEEWELVLGRELTNE